MKPLDRYTLRLYLSLLLWGLPVSTKQDAEDLLQELQEKVWNKYEQIGVDDDSWRNTMKVEKSETNLSNACRCRVTT